ncbi:hypothetical protein BH18ACT2_BH18ACT2_13070 [soil metagenome]
MSDERTIGASHLPIETVREAIYSKRFLAADRARLDVAEIGSWDEFLLREHRLLVPIDVQALYVPEGGDEPMVRLPMLVAGPGGQGVQDVEDGMPDPFTDGEPRPPGVHLHWAMPDALLRGRLAQDATATNRLGLPPLPDRWVVLRLLHPRGASDPVVTGWVIEADRAIAVPIEQWREDDSIPAGVEALGEPIIPEELTGTVGGAVSWASTYDAVVNRFAFHDPLGDISAGPLANGVADDCATYVVAGWWKDPAHDPLDAARSTDSLHELLERLRWRLLYEWGDERGNLERERAEFELRKALGLTTQARWSSPRPPVVPGARAAGPGGRFVPMASGVQELIAQPVSAVFAT